eukprot:1157504-Pelagomonas_calceolata.AAC.3
MSLLTYIVHKGVPGALLGHKVAKEGQRPSLPLVMPEGYRALLKKCWDQKPEKRCGQAVGFGCFYLSCLWVRGHAVGTMIGGAGVKSLSLGWLLSGRKIWRSTACIWGCARCFCVFCAKTCNFKWNIPYIIFCNSWCTYMPMLGLLVSNLWYTQHTVSCIVSHAQMPTDCWALMFRALK